MKNPSERTVKVSGVSCRVWEQGEGEPVAFMAGIGGLPRWTRFLEILSESRRVIVPTIPGFPGSSGIGMLDDHLDWLIATHDLLGEAGAEGADLIGVSLGAALAADVAAVWPASVRRVVLVSPLGLFDDSNPTADIFAQNPSSLGKLLCQDPAKWEIHIALPDSIDPVEWEVIKVRAQEAAARLLWPLGDTRLTRRLHRITQPSLLVFGESDRVLPDSYRNLYAREISHSEVVVLNNSGLLADLDSPADLAATVKKFFLAC